MQIKKSFELFAEKLEIGWGKAFFGDVPSRVFTLAMYKKTTSILLGIYSTFVMSDHHKRPQKSTCRVCKLGLLILDLIRGGGGGWGGGGYVDDNVTQTHPTVPPQEPFLLGIYSTFVMSDFLTGKNPARNIPEKSLPATNFEFFCEQFETAKFNMHTPEVGVQIM